MGCHDGLPPAPSMRFDGGSLRPWRLGDAQRLVDAWADPDITRWNAVPPDPSTATATRWIAGQQVRLDRRLSLDMVIVEERSDVVVGEVGLSGFSRSVRGALVGYWLLPEARGRGLAAKAVAALCAWAHDALELDVIVARCHESNAASCAVAASAGFVHEATESSGHQVWRSRTRSD